MADAAKFENGKRLKDWVIIETLDEGSFGQVYKVENRLTKELAALKAEPNDVEGGSVIKLELAAIKAMTEDGPKPHQPILYHAAKHRKFCYMVMTLLGDNLKTLKMSCPKELMTPQTWSRIAIQCLYSVKLVHDYGYIHRNIKPSNFVMGHKLDHERHRIVHILDFGLARSFAYKKNGKWYMRKGRPRGSVVFRAERSTVLYCSRNLTDNTEPGRKDDLMDLLYVLIKFHCGLPWQTVRDKAKVEAMKKNIPDHVLVQNFPVELHGIVPYLKTLEYYQRPDYSMFHNGLVAIMDRLNVKPNDPFDWETKDQVQTVLKNRKSVPAWESAVEFFKSDPIGLSVPAIRADGSIVQDNSRNASKQETPN